MNFSKIEYPKCPSCKAIINDVAIFNMRDLSSSPYWQIKTCPCCNGKFLMKTKVILETEVEEYGEEVK